MIYVIYYNVTDFLNNLYYLLSVMFVSLRRIGSHSSHIDRFAMDGSGRTHVIEQDLVGPISLHYDSDVHRVFFADAGTGNIESTSVEGKVFSVF